VVVGVEAVVVVDAQAPRIVARPMVAISRVLGRGVIGCVSGSKRAR
jgi:hypothetical protein